MPEYRLLTPVRRVADLDRSLAFYGDRLGFTLVWRAAHDGDNALLAAGPLRLLLSPGVHPGDPPRPTGTLSFETADVRALYEALRDDVPLVWPLEAMEYGQTEFGVHDPDGYVLASAQPHADDGRNAARAP